MITENSEKNIVLRLKQGNIHAFNKMFNEYSTKLYVFALGYLKSKEEAEGLVQDVFTKIWEKRNDLDPKLSFKSYLFTIAYNGIKKKFRKKAQFRKFVNSQLFVDTTDYTMQSVDYNSLKNYIFKIISSLPKRRRTIFVKSRLEGFTNDEIAKELGIKKKTVENQINLAIREIKGNLKRADFSLILYFSLFIR